MKTTTPYSEGKYICTSCNNVSDTYSITCRCGRENLTSPKHGEKYLMKRVSMMQDGTTAVLTNSGSYYVRQMYKGESYTRPLKRGEKWDRVEYYSLTGDYIPLACMECEKCGETVQSQYCGHYVSCSCGHTSVDTDRWMPERHRYLTK